MPIDNGDDDHLGIYMNRLNLTDAERALVAQMAASSESVYSRLWFYAACLVPSVSFGIYGALQKDIVALGLGFLALCLFIGWSIFNEMKSTPFYIALFKKIDAFDRDNQN